VKSLLLAPGHRSRGSSPSRSFRLDGSASMTAGSRLRTTSIRSSRKVRSLKRILLDTNAWLWMSGASKRLRPRDRHILEDQTNEVFFSVITAWEIVIKSRLGKLKVVGAPDDYVRSRLQMQRLTILP